MSYLKLLLIIIRMLCSVLFIFDWLKGRNAQNINIDEKHVQTQNTITF